jgi:hypothetical protein
MGNLTHLRLAASAVTALQPYRASELLDEIEEPAKMTVREVLMRAVNDLHEVADGDVQSMALQRAVLRLAIGVDRSPSKEPQPVDLWQHYEAPEIPRGLLPVIIEDFAFAQGELMGADPAGIAMSALAICAAAIPNGIKVRVKRHDDWEESARLWVGLVGMPSTKKSPIISAAAKPLRKLNDALVARHQAECNTLARLPKKDRETAEQPRQVRLLTEDSTPESLQNILKHSPDGIISLQDELSGWFGAMDKYNSGRGAAADRAFWLQAFNGGAYAVDRVTRGLVSIPALSIGLLGGIQPDPMRKIANDLADDGLIQRFLPIILRPARVGRDVPAGDHARNYSTLVERLNRLRPLRRSGNLAGIAPVRFDDQAQLVRDRFEVENFELQSALETVSPKLAAHFGKHEGIFARLCLLWHCIEATDEFKPTISGEVAERVASFMASYLRPSAIAFYSDILGVAGGHEVLMEIASIIVSERLEEVTARDVSRPSRAVRGRSVDEILRHCQKLESFGCLEPIEPRAKSNSPRWRVVAAVHEMFADRGRQEKERREAARRVVMEAFANG